MNFSQQKSDFSPIPYFLQNNKIPDLIRIMFNRKVSQDYLVRYGKEPQPPLKPSQLHRINDYLNKFQLREIIHVKGSKKQKVLVHTNTFLQMCFKKKIEKQMMFTPTERKRSWVQLTQYFQSSLLFQELDEFELPLTLEQTIEKDVRRTELSQDYLGVVDQNQRIESNIQMRARLTTILQKFAKYNPYIGYCQGMNNVVLFLIEEGFDDIEAFFIMKKITEELLPCDFYSSMNSVISFVKLICQVLAQTHPKVVKVMKVVVRNNGGDGITLTTGFVLQWFICLFTNSNLKRDMRRCILDHFMLQGLPALLKASLAYFDAIQPQVDSAKYLQQYNPIVERTIRQYSNLNNLHKRLSQMYINKYLFDLILDKLTFPTEGRKKYVAKYQCDHKWTTCLQTVQNNFSEGYTHDFFVFKTAEPLKIVNNYLQNSHKNGYFNIKNVDKNDQTKLGRMQHTCRIISGTQKTEDMQGSIPQLQKTVSENCNRSQLSPQSKISDFNRHLQIVQPERKQMVRSKALQQLQSQIKNRQSMLKHSQSVQFMSQMIQNQSFSNLMEILQVEQMEDLFRQAISQNQDDQA